MAENTMLYHIMYVQYVINSIYFIDTRAIEFCKKTLGVYKIL